jgi:primosomal protein N' (replication factor Y)
MLEETLASFRSGDIDILVGTQIVAKGLDFPNVTLVGVIAADISLNLPDFRSSERTFQLLSQVAGRAGRGTSPGEVVIQTFNPEHVAVVAAQTHDYLQLFEILKEEREVAGYPPFRRLVNILLSSENRRSLLDASEEIKQLLVERAGVDATPAGGLSISEERRARFESPTHGAQLLGPVDCVMERLQNRWRRHLLLKLIPGASLQPIAQALHAFRAKGVQVVIDVDPYSLM